MIILFDTNFHLVKSWIKLFTIRSLGKRYQNVKILHSNFEKLDNYDFLVSPANSFGYMDGGIDEFYSKKYPNIGSVVRKRISEIGIKNNQNLFYLPVGSVIVVDIPNTNQKLICAPTMYYPSNIQNTNNVYHVFRAILEIYKRNPNIIMAVPGLGTGVGGIDEKECALNMFKAYKDFINNEPLKPDIQRTLKIDNRNNLVYSRTICYQNSEVFNRLIKNGHL